MTAVYRWESSATLDATAVFLDAIPATANSSSPLHVVVSTQAYHDTEFRCHNYVTHCISHPSHRFSRVAIEL
jgi:hypothetical protein